MHVERCCQFLTIIGLIKSRMEDPSRISRTLLLAMFESSRRGLWGTIPRPDSQDVVRVGACACA